jgi:hypothetical protein
MAGQRLFAASQHERRDTLMASIEDFELVVETAEGSTQAVISKTALRALAGRSGSGSSDIALTHADALKIAVERKLATGHYAVGDQVRIHATDL